MTTTNSSAAEPADKIDATRVAPDPVGELLATPHPGTVAVTVVDSLEVVDVEEKDRQRLAAQRGILEKRGQDGSPMRAAIVQPGERVENGHLDAMLEPHAQMIDITLALDPLRARPCQQLVAFSGAAI